jgi:hypothetical protein
VEKRLQDQAFAKRQLKSLVATAPTQQRANIPDG